MHIQILWDQLTGRAKMLSLNAETFEDEQVLQCLARGIVSEATFRILARSDNVIDEFTFREQD